MPQPKIPKKFELGGQTFRVEITDDLIPEEGAYGMFRSHSNKIQLCEGINQDKLCQTFYHELTHAILHTMGSEHWDDEQLVDLFGTFLHQFMSTQWGRIEVNVEDKE